MRLHALIFALFVLGAHAASIPDKRDIEKKLAAVVKEVLNKDEVPVENVASEQELVEPIDVVKDVENNLKKSAQPSDIPVKVVLEDVQPVLKNDDKKEDNEVSPASEESDEIVREEIDLKNPGPPQRMQHDTQNPEHFEDAQQAIVLKNSAWKGSTQYAEVQKEIKELKDTFENKMTELFESLQEHMKTHTVHGDDENTEKEEIKVRSSVRQDSSSPAGGSGTANSTGQWGNGPFGGFFQNWASSFQQNLQNLNTTVNNYWSNSTNSNSTTSDSCNGTSSSPSNIFSWGNNNPLNFGQQQGQGQQQQQSDEPARPGLWQTVQQNVQNFFQGNPQPPAGAQSDTPQPAQPNRPVIQAFQSVLEQAGSLFQRPGQSQTPPQQQPSQATTQEGANVVPVESKPEGEKKKPEQVTPQPQQSGPIIQMIGNNPVAQGLAGAVQRIQHAIIPPKPREDIKKTGEKADKDTKGGFFPPPPPPNRPTPGDNNDISGSGIESMKPEETPAKEAIEEPTSEAEKAPAAAQDKTE